MIRPFLVAACVITLAASSNIFAGAEARLVLSGKVNLSGDLPVYSEDSVNFYATHVYLLESGLLRRRTEEALGHPAPGDLKITADRVQNTSIILVTARSADELLPPSAGR